MPKKINPRKRPASYVDVERARDDGFSFGFEFTAYIQLFILSDKFGFDIEQIKKFVQYFEMYCEQISRGEVNYADLRDVVKKEYNYDIELKRYQKGKKQ